MKVRVKYIKEGGYYQALDMDEKILFEGDCWKVEEWLRDNNYKPGNELYIWSKL